MQVAVQGLGAAPWDRGDGEGARERAEKQQLLASLRELQQHVQQEASRRRVWGSKWNMLDVLEHDWQKAQNSRQELY